MAVFFGNDFWVSDWDPTYIREIVERTMRYGGSFYVNGIHNKGPLEPIVYRFAATFSSWDSYWYAVTVLVMVLAFCVAFGDGHYRYGRCAR